MQVIELTRRHRRIRTYPPTCFTLYRVVCWCWSEPGAGAAFISKHSSGAGAGAAFISKHSSGAGAGALGSPIESSGAGAGAFKFLFQAPEQELEPFNAWKELRSRSWSRAFLKVKLRSGSWSTVSSKVKLRSRSWSQVKIQPAPKP